MLHVLTDFLTIMMLLRLKLPCGLNTFKNKTSFQWTKHYNYGATALKYFTVFSLLSGQYQAIRIKYEVCLCLSVTQRNDCMHLANLKFIRQIDITLMVAVCQCWSLISVYLSLFFCIQWKEGCIHPSIHPSITRSTKFIHCRVVVGWIIPSCHWATGCLIHTG